jgi:hypothetical protein
MTEKTFYTEKKHIGTTEYTLNIDLSLPDGCIADSEGHFNRLYVSFEGIDEGPDKQNEIVLEHPEFPIGVPVRGLGRDVTLVVVYRLRYFQQDTPDQKMESLIRYKIPVRFDGNKDQINLNKTLPLL